MLIDNIAMAEVEEEDEASNMMEKGEIRRTIVKAGITKSGV